MQAPSTAGWPHLQSRGGRSNTDTANSLVTAPERPLSPLAETISDRLNSRENPRLRRGARMADPPSSSMAIALVGTSERRDQSSNPGVGLDCVAVGTLTGTVGLRAVSSRRTRV